MADEFIREAVGVFHDEQTLQAAADELMISGFDRSLLSILAGHRTIEKTLGHRYERVAELEDESGLPRLAYIGPDSRTEAKGAISGGLAYVGAAAAAGSVVASGGAIATVILAAAAVGGAGGVIGAVLARFIERHHAQYLEDHIDHGGILLWVRTLDEEHEKRAVEILTRHSADDVHVHALPAPESHTGSKEGVSYDLSFMNRLGM